MLTKNNNNNKVFLNEEKLIMINSTEMLIRKMTLRLDHHLQCEGQFKLKNKFPGNYLI